MSCLPDAVVRLALSLPDPLAALFLRRLQGWVQGVRTAYARAVDRSHFQVTPLTFVGDRPLMFYGPLGQAKPLPGVRMYYDRLQHSDPGGPQRLQPLQGSLPVTVWASYCTLCGRPSPTDAVVSGDVTSTLPHVFCLHRRCSPHVLSKHVDPRGNGRVS